MNEPLDYEAKPQRPKGFGFVVTGVVLSSAGMGLVVCRDALGMRLLGMVMDVSMVFAAAGIAVGIATLAMGWNRTWSLTAIAIGVATLFTLSSIVSY